MSIPLIDLRAKVTPEADAVLEAIQRATGKDKSEVVRDVLHKWAMFQSTPAIADGRTRARPAKRLSSGSFNPRPPSLTGEPCLECRGRRLRFVSIHARHR